MAPFLVLVWSGPRDADPLGIHIFGGGFPSTVSCWWDRMAERMQVPEKLVSESTDYYKGPSARSSSQPRSDNTFLLHPCLQTNTMRFCWPWRPHSMRSLHRLCSGVSDRIFSDNCMSYWTGLTILLRPSHRPCLLCCPFDLVSKNLSSFSQVSSGLLFCQPGNVACVSRALGSVCLEW